jgi:Flp pilus assembly protein CpaB
MRRGRVFIYLALIIILGLIALVVIWQRFLVPSNQGTTAEEQPTPVVTTVNIIVLTQRVPRGAALTADVMGMIPIQQELFIQGMYTNISDAEGKLAKFDLDSGIPLTSSMVVDSAEQLSSTGSNAALTIPRGMVAVSIPINRLSSVSYAPRPGDHVNVIVAMNFIDLDPDFQTSLPNRNIGIIAPGSGSGTLSSSVGGDTSGATGSTNVSLDATTSIVAVSGGGGGMVGRVVTDPVLAQTFYNVPSEPSQRPRMVSQNLLQDAVVLQVGNFSIKDETQAASSQAEPTPQPGGAQATPAPEPPAPDLITLIVTPQDAITLNYLVYSGAKLTLALRPAGDDTRVNTESVTLQFLLEQYNVSVPAKLPTGMQPNNPLPQTDFTLYSSAPTPVP